MSNTANTLTIDLNEEYKIKIEEPSKLSDSYFKDIYQRAAKATADILKKSEDADKIKDNPFKRQGEEYNNIIAFCGERGTGKSSAMITFAQALLNIEEADLIKKLDVTDKYKLSSYKYFSTEVIDPSMFEEKENIFEVVLAQLFSAFSKKLNDKNSNTNHEQKRKVLEAFQTVYDDLKTVQKNGEKYNGEALETLAKLSCGANLRSNFKDLVQHYLDFIKCDKEDKAYLIIPIDDFDLNVKAVADMAEQIRKYLMIPKVVILMAADIKQLSDAKEQSVRHDFATLIKADAMTETPKFITAKYLLKLIPVERRLLLPSIKIDGKTTTINIENSSFYNEENDYSNESIEELILRVINEKTGLIFLKPEYQLSYFVPRTLRGLRSFLIFLNSLNKAKDKNLTEFKDNFITKWCFEELDKQHFDLIENWLNLEFVERNKFFITKTFDLLRDSFAQKFNNKNEKIKEVLEWNGIYSESLNEISAKDNYPINVSLGDVLLAIKQLEFINDIELNKYCFAIKTLYSIEMIGLLNFSFFKNENKLSDENEIEALNKLYRIVGGQIIPENEDILKISNVNHIGFDILPRRRIEKIAGEYESRQSFNIKYSNFQFHHVLEVVDKQVRAIEIKNFSEYENEIKKLVEISINDESELDNNQIFQLTNFENMLLFQFFLIHIGVEDYPKRRRIDDDGYYNQTLGTTKATFKEKSKFDVFTFFLTSVFPEQIWKRNHLSDKYCFQGLFNQMIIERRKGNLLFPIYSIDLLIAIFNRRHFNQSLNVVDYNLPNVEIIDIQKLFSGIQQDLESIIIASIPSYKINSKPIWYEGLEKENKFEDLIFDFWNNKITERRDVRLKRSVYQAIDKITIDSVNFINSYNAKVAVLISSIKALSKDDVDNDILRPLIEKIDKCRVRLNTISNNISAALINSDNEKELNLNEDQTKKIIIDSYYRLKEIINE